MIVGKYVLVGTPIRTTGFAWPSMIAGNDRAALPPSTTARRVRLIFLMDSSSAPRVARKKTAPIQGPLKSSQGGGGGEICELGAVCAPSVSPIFLFVTVL